MDTHMYLVARGIYGSKSYNLHWPLASLAGQPLGSTSPACAYAEIGSGDLGHRFNTRWGDWKRKISRPIQ